LKPQVSAPLKEKPATGPDRDPFNSILYDVNITDKAVIDPVTIPFSRIMFYISLTFPKWLFSPSEHLSVFILTS
jgi:hypothetical protein